MVTSANLSRSASNVQFSFAQDLIGRAQRVETSLRGYQYSGEVIVASEWRAEYGQKLTGAAMFRMVLLQSCNGPSSVAIGDKRICFAVQQSSKSSGDGLREATATHDVGDGASVSEQASTADIQTLREV